ncbi:MAG: hypothetical protein ACOH2T_19240 [Pseudomonas sp.]
MKIRPSGGLLADTMKEVSDIPPTAEAICDWLNLDAMVVSGLMPPTTPDELVIRPYVKDERTDWDNHMVIVAGIGPLAWVDGPLESSSANEEGAY